MTNPADKYRFRLANRLKQLLLVALAWLLTACMGAYPPQPAVGSADYCQAYFEKLDHLLLETGHRDQGEAPIAGFPYLRVNRFLASFAAEKLTDQQLYELVERMALLDASAREDELKNLGEKGKQFDQPTLNNCRKTLLTRDRSSPKRLNTLTGNIEVPDEYRIDWRILGLYPLASVFVRMGVDNWHRQAREQFSLPRERHQPLGKFIRWSSTADRVKDDRDSKPVLLKSPLGIPELSPGDLQRLFNAHAPVWEVDVVSRDDRIGRPYKAAEADVDIDDPVEYRLASYTRFNNDVLLQLNYVIWFASRPGRDMYSGRLDGLTWRVTLDAKGEPLVYDSIHNCGCYHQFFPAQQLSVRKGLDKLPEPPLIPAKAPEGQPVVIRLKSKTHYISQVYADPAADIDQPLRSANYRVLRSGNIDGSLFDNHGIITGTERNERFLFWPTGVRSPGAMRQWGRHATAFIGRRHFDDPFLFEHLFRRNPE